MKLSRKTGESTKSVEQSGSIELDPSSIIRGLALSVRKRSVSKWDGLGLGPLALPLVGGCGFPAGAGQGAAAPDFRGSCQPTWI